MSEFESFEINIGGREVSLAVGRCAVAMFREQQEVSYIAIDQEDDTTLRVFNNQSFAEFLAGYRIVEDAGVLYRPVVRQDFNGVNMAFHEITGWSPAIVERERPSESEMEMFLDVNSMQIDDEWGSMG